MYGDSSSTMDNVVGRSYLSAPSSASYMEHIELLKWYFVLTFLHMYGELNMMVD